MILALIITLYYMGLVFVKMTQIDVPFMFTINISFGCLASVISLFIISPLLGWIYMSLGMLIIIAFVFFKNGKEILKWLKSCFERSHDKGMSDTKFHTSEEHDIESLQVKAT